MGKLLLKASAETLKRTSMELGGHAPVIVYEDADTETVAEQAAIVKFKHCGQVCASHRDTLYTKKVLMHFLKNLLKSRKNLNWVMA